MTDRTFARARATLGHGADFPIVPVLPAERLCDGVCLVSSDGFDERSLAGLRVVIGGLWRDVLTDGSGLSVLIAIFTRAVLVPAREFPAALRLARNSADEWSSFEMQRGDPSIGAGGVAPVHGAVRLWWSGSVHTVKLSPQCAISLEALWRAPDIVIHRPLPRQKARSAGAGPRGQGRDDKADATMPVLRATSENAVAKLPDFLRQTEDRLAELDRRNTLRGIVMDAFRLWSLRQNVRDPAQRGSGKRGASAGGAAGDAGEPGLLSRLAGWVRWRTPFGVSLRGQFSRRLDLVEKLIRSGAIDDALKLALRLGYASNRGQGKTLFPNRLPDARGSLDFIIDDARFSAPILADGSFHALRDRYASLAKELAAKGDFRRSAYISSQLLGDHGLAVRTLEQGGLLAEATKLAYESGQPPSIVIRLLYKLGERDAALALAKRTACFDTLAASSRYEDPAFHAFVIKAWTDQLVATDQYARALAVTDELVKGTKGGKLEEGLLAARRTWLAHALSLSPPLHFNAELVGRTLLTAHWTTADIADDGLADFPSMRHVAGCAPFVGCLTELQRVLEASNAEAKAPLLHLVHVLVKHGDAATAEQSAFWAGPAARVLEPLARAVLEKASDGLRREDLDDLRGLLQKASSPVLAADFRKLKSVYRAPATTKEGWIAPPSSGARPRVRHVCLFENGQLLAARESGELELIGRHGESVWTGLLDDVVGLVAVGASPNALVLQRHGAESVRLSRFSAVSKTVSPIGVARLLAWHDLTSDGQWLVQIDGDVGALDLAELLAQTPRVVFLWSVGITRRLLVRAFYHDPLSPSWITLDISPERGGVQEVWTLLRGRELRTNLLTGVDTRQPLLHGDARGVSLLPRGLWRFHSPHGVCVFTGLTPGTMGVAVQLLAWSDSAEKLVRSAIAQPYDALGAGLDQFQSDDFGRVHVFNSVAGDERAEIVVRDVLGKRTFSLKFGPGLGVSLVARAGVASPRGGEPAQVAMFADASGRLHRLDLDTGVVFTCD